MNKLSKQHEMMLFNQYRSESYRQIVKRSKSKFHLN